MVCPKCSTQIKRFDLSPVCKNCGIHIMYYTQERDLARDAKRTELEFAKARIFVGKLKCAFIGSKYAIARMVLMLVTLGVLFIPCGSITVQLPLFSEKIAVSGWGIYQLFSNGTYSVILDYLNSGLAQDTAVKALVWYALFLLIVLAVAILLVLWLLCFTEIRKGSKRLCVCSIVGLAFTVLTAVMGIIVNASVNSSGESVYSFLTVSLGAGAYVILLVLGAFLAVNLLFIKSGIYPQTKEVDLQRIEILNKVKAGEIRLDDLSLPILETDEEREKRLNAFGSDTEKKDKKKKKAKKGEKQNV